MSKSIRFGARSTADKVLAGIDLSGKRFVVTGCNSGIGFETMSSLAANGAQVIGLARSLRTRRPHAAGPGPTALPVACDLADLDSVAEAAEAIRALHRRSMPSSPMPASPTCPPCRPGTASRCNFSSIISATSHW